jgi:hypothetical protein
VSLLVFETKEEKIMIEYYPPKLEEEVIYNVSRHLKGEACCYYQEAEGYLMEG